MQKLGIREESLDRGEQRVYLGYNDDSLPNATCFKLHESHPVKRDPFPQI